MQIGQDMHLSDILDNLLRLTRRGRTQDDKL